MQVEMNEVSIFKLSDYKDAQGMENEINRFMNNESYGIKAVNQIVFKNDLITTITFVSKFIEISDDLT